MREARVPWTAFAGLVGIAVGVAFAVVTLVGVTRDDGGGASLPNGIVARVDVTPRTAAFGAPIVAMARVVVDHTLISPTGVRLETAFAPYKTLSTHVTRRDTGRLTELRYSLTLDCLTQECLPPMKRKREFAFPAATIRYVEGHTPRALPLRWPRVGLASHLTVAELTADQGVNPLFVADLGRSGLTFTKVIANLRDSADTVPAVSYRVSPDGLSAGLFAFAALLALSSGAVLFSRLWPRQIRAAAPDRRSPVERALSALEVALVDGHVAEQRRALELLGRALGEDGDEPRARRARSLAWSRPTLPRDDARVLAEDVRETIEVEGNGRP